MEPTSKLTLSAEELRLVSDTGWILTKQSIIDKVYGIFGLLADRYQALAVVNALPAELLHFSPKIARGENYRQLPYVMLDYPRFFAGDQVFAIRTFFWWGHFFSITLQLSGEYRSRYAAVLSQSYDVLVAGDFHLCIGDDAWEHHFGDDNYVPLDQCGRSAFEKKIQEGAFIKLAQQFPLPDWDKIPGLLEERFGTIVNLLRSASQPVK